MRTALGTRQRLHLVRLRHLQAATEARTSGVREKNCVFDKETAAAALQRAPRTPPIPARGDRHAHGRGATRVGAGVRQGLDAAVRGHGVAAGEAAREGTRRGHSRTRDSVELCCSAQHGTSDSVRRRGCALQTACRQHPDSTQTAFTQHSDSMGAPSASVGAPSRQQGAALPLQVHPARVRHTQVLRPQGHAHASLGRGVQATSSRPERCALRGAREHCHLTQRECCSVRACAPQTTGRGQPPLLFRDGSACL